MCRVDCFIIKDVKQTPESFYEINYLEEVLIFTTYNIFGIDYQH